MPSIFPKSFQAQFSRPPSVRSQIGAGLFTGLGMSLLFLFVASFHPMVGGVFFMAGILLAGVGLLAFPLIAFNLKKGTAKRDFFTSFEDTFCVSGTLGLILSGMSSYYFGFSVLSFPLVLVVGGGIASLVLLTLPLRLLLFFLREKNAQFLLVQKEQEGGVTLNGGIEPPPHAEGRTPPNTPFVRRPPLAHCEIQAGT